MRNKLIVLCAFILIFPACQLMADERIEVETGGEPIHFDQKVFDHVDGSGVVTANSLDAINVALTEFRKIKELSSIDYYIVKSESLEQTYKVYFLVPRNKPVLGGGTVIFEIGKNTLNVLSMEILK